MTSKWRDCRMWGGKEFHILGAEIRKAWEPIERLWRGTESLQMNAWTWQVYDNVKARRGMADDRYAMLYRFIKVEVLLFDINMWTLMWYYNNDYYDWRTLSAKWKNTYSIEPQFKFRTIKNSCHCISLRTIANAFVRRNGDRSVGLFRRHHWSI